MYVLGVDPGVARCGYALLSRSAGSIEVHEAGVIRTEGTTALPRRLLEIFESLREIMALYTLDVMVVERVVFKTNAKSAMAVGQALGAAFMAAESSSIPVAQVSSNEMKLTLVGDGSAEKWQLRAMVQRLLGTEQPIRPPDVVDAIGLAFCFLSASETVREGWRLS
jgi:crossover junction endodeoxyribonuclease RuvC